LDLRSPTKTLALLKGEVDVDVEKTEVGELQSVTVIVTGIYDHIIHVDSTAGKDFVEFEEGLADFSDTYDRSYVTITDPYTGKTRTNCYAFDVTMEEDGQMEFSVRFYDTGAYTIEVTDLDTDDEDTEDVKVSEKDVTFDMPSTVVIGEDLEIRGTANAGDYVDIAIEDYIAYVGIPIEADGTFEEDLRTPETRGTGAPGSIVIEAFIRVAGEPAPKVGDLTRQEEDGSTSILLTAGSLTADISTLAVAQEDEFTVEGTAGGSDFVDIVTIAPKGGSGRGINPASVDPSVPGITWDSSAVSDMDYSYLKDIYVDQDADTGKYMIIVVSPGRNGVYDEINSPYLFGSEFVAKYGDVKSLGSKTQGQIVAILRDATIGAAGSDDLMWIGTIIVGEIETETLTLNPIVDVVVGNQLEVTGETSRNEGSIIWITVKGRYQELVPQAAFVKDNSFNATFDTTGAHPGTYTVKAIDGYGYTHNYTCEYHRVRRKREKMNRAKKMESKRRWQKAIIGIAIAAIMLAFVMVAMAPTVSAKDITGDYLTIRNGYQVNPAFVVIEITDGDTNAIKIGQEIIFKGATGTVLIEGIPDTNTDGEAFSASAPSSVGIAGIYFDTTSMGRTGTYIVSCEALGESQFLSVSRPTIPIQLKVGPEVVSAITVGTNLRIDCSWASDLSPNDCVNLIITDPRGRQIKTWTVGGKNQYYDEINVDQLIKYGSTDTAMQVDTEDWILGSYTFYVVTEEENARGLDLSSTSKTLELIKGEVDIDVDKTDVVELQSVTVTITGIYGHTMHVASTAGMEFVEFEEGLADFADTYDRSYVTITDPFTGKTRTSCYGFDVTMEEDCQMQFSVRFYDTGAYTIEVTDLDTGDEDTEDVKVSKKEVRFDIPML
jgi:hypothetical protein